MKRKSNKLELLLVLVLVLTLVPIGNCNVMAEGESGEGTTSGAMTTDSSDSTMGGGLQELLKPNLP